MLDMTCVMLQTRVKGEGNGDQRKYDHLAHKIEEPTKEKPRTVVSLTSETVLKNCS